MGLRHCCCCRCCCCLQKLPRTWSQATVVQATALNRRKQTGDSVISMEKGRGAGRKTLKADRKRELQKERAALPPTSPSAVAGHWWAKPPGPCLALGGRHWAAKCLLACMYPAGRACVSLGLYVWGSCLCGCMCGCLPLGVCG